MKVDSRITKLEELQVELDKLDNRSELQLLSEEKYRRSLVEDIRQICHDIGYDPKLIRSIDSLLSL